MIDGWTEIGDANEIFPMASVGLIPQDLKFGGERTRLVIGNRNVIREFATIHRGTAGGGGLTRIGDHNLFMAYAHVAHDCQVGNETIFGNGATLAGHVVVEDYANVGAFSGVHQFCRVGSHAFIGGYSVVTKDALPFAKTVGNRARIYGLNTIGLVRRKFSPDAIAKLRRAYRYLLHSNTSRALAQIEQDPTLHCPEVQYVVDFIRTSKRGVGLRRPSRRLKKWPTNEAGLRPTVVREEAIDRVERRQERKMLRVINGRLFAIVLLACLAAACDDDIPTTADCADAAEDGDLHRRRDSERRCDPQLRRRRGRCRDGALEDASAATTRWSSALRSAPGPARHAASCWRTTPRPAAPC